MKFNDRTGEKSISKFGAAMTIEKYINNKNIIVRFENGYTMRTAYQQFKNGNVKSVYDKTVYGVGFIGEGDYPTTINGVNTQAYKVWHGMMRRGYDPDLKDRSPSYKEVTVCEHWHNYQNFTCWFEENFYEVEGGKMNLDKDILVKGNKEYSPDTCIFVPAYINTLIANSETNHGKFLTCVYPTYRIDKKYSVRSRLEFIGNFRTLEEAFNAYKRHKEIKIRDTANKYKEKIPHKLYEALLNYKIERKYMES